jgi:hypothetical protein
MQAQMHRRDFDQCFMPVSDPDESGQGRGTGTPQRMEETSMQSAKNGDLIYSYTIDQATQDGILFDIRKVNPEWERGIFSHVTMNLLSLGYLNADRSVNLPNLLDLLNQSLAIVRRESADFQKHDYFFSGSIELPSGSRQVAPASRGLRSLDPDLIGEIFIVQNETGKYTLMLASDY